jgi:hypothetical protein
MRTILFIIGILILAGCKREENEDEAPLTKISGFVVSTGSQKPIEGVLVKIYDGMPSGGMLSTGTSKRTHNKDSVFTDKDGKFSIELRAYEPVINLRKKGYVFEYQLEGAVLGIMPVNPGVTLTNVKLNLDAVAFFNPVLMNKVSQKDDDYLIVYLLGRYNSPFITNNFSGNGPFKFYPYDKEGILVLGDSYSKYKILFLRDGKQNTIFDSVYIAPEEIYIDTIFY